MEFVAGGVKENNGERQASFVPPPLAFAAITLLWLAYRAPEEQGEHGVFSQVTEFSK